MLIPLSLVETKLLNWRRFQGWFHQIPALHCPPAITVTSTQLSLECFSQHPVATAFFGHYFSYFTEGTTRELKTVLISLSWVTEWDRGVGIAGIHKNPWGIPTKHRPAKSRSGRAERMRSQRQPSVGITTTARSTSNTVPRAQNTWERENQQKNEEWSAPKASSLEQSRLCSPGMAGERNSKVRILPENVPRTKSCPEWLWCVWMKMWSWI